MSISEPPSPEIRASAGSTSSADSPGTLFANALAVDVGGTCWGGNEPLPIIDHHFPRESQFPSASAAILHKASQSASASPNADVVWLVTHKEPDFDAFCSMYLARWIIETPDLPDLGAVRTASEWLAGPAASAEDLLVQSRSLGRAARTSVGLPARQLRLCIGNQASPLLPAATRVALDSVCRASSAGAIT